MTASKLLAIAGQQSFPFGARGAPEFVHANPSAEVLVITPKYADYLLKSADHEGMDSPRHIANVAAFKRTMLAYGWRLNGDALVVDRSGRLIDGRARCQACAESGVPFATVLFRGVPCDAEYTLDMKSVRSKADTLYVSGVANHHVVARACEVIHRYLNEPGRETFVVRRRTASTLDNSAVKLMTELYPQIEASAQLVEHVDMPGFSPTVLTVAHFLMTLVDIDAAERFVTCLVDHKVDPTGIPTRLARKSKATRKGLTEGRDTMALAILGKCWKANLAGDTFYAGLTAYAGRVEGDDTGREGFPGFGVPGDVRIVLDVGADLSVLMSANPAALEGMVRSQIARQGVTAEVVRLEPADAEAFLRVNGPNGNRNRRIRPDQVAYLMVEIEGGRWMLNGQGIKFSEGGYMIDGQHRCTAVVRTGIAIDTLVVRGLDDEVFSTFDGGQRNSYAKVTQSKETYANERGAALRVLGMIEEDDENARITPTLQRSLEGEYPNLGEGVIAAKDCQDILSHAVGAALYAVFARSHEATAKAFFRSLGDGAELDEGMPVYTLREKLLKFGRNKSDRTHAKHARWAIHAWNATVTRRSLMQIKDTKGPGFPAIAGN